MKPDAYTPTPAVKAAKPMSEVDSVREAFDEVGRLMARVIGVVDKIAGCPGAESGSDVEPVSDGVLPSLAQQARGVNRFVYRVHLELDRLEAML